MKADLKADDSLGTILFSTVGWDGSRCVIVITVSELLRTISTVIISLHIKHVCGSYEMYKVCINTT